MSKRIMATFLLLVIMILAWCTNKQEVKMLQEQNDLLKQQINILTEVVGDKKTEKTSSTTTTNQNNTSTQKQQAINKAKKERDACYANIETSLDAAEEMCATSVWLNCYYDRTKVTANATEQCKQEYERKLRTIDLEF